MSEVKREAELLKQRKGFPPFLPCDSRSVVSEKPLPSPSSGFLPRGGCSQTSELLREGVCEAVCRCQDGSALPPAPRPAAMFLPRLPAPHVAGVIPLLADPSAGPMPFSALSKCYLGLGPMQEQPSGAP